MTFHYLATPYSRYKGGIYNAFEEAARQAALLVQAGVKVYSPIAHTHPVAIHGNLDPFDHTLWLEADRAFMDAAVGLIVCQMDGWRESFGIAEEIKHFKAQGKPIVYMTPGVIPPNITPKRRDIIGLCGFATVGKDTAAQGLIDAGWTRVALADGVREAVAGFDCNVAMKARDIGWDALKECEPEIRGMLQRMGTEAGRNIHGYDCWIKLAKRKIDAAPGNVVITDVRFANEAAAIRSWGGKIIRIDRPGVGPVNDHASEAMPFEPDTVIVNDGTIEQLQELLCAKAGIRQEAVA